MDTGLCAMAGSRRVIMRGLFRSAAGPMKQARSWLPLGQTSPAPLPAGRSTGIALDGLGDALRGEERRIHSRAIP